MRQVFVITVLALAACGGDTVVQGVSCKADTDCKLQGVQGTCESTGFCAYPDDTCAGGLRYSPGATGMSDQCVGGPAACGAKDQACCANDVCGTDLACVSGTCTCGDKDEPCCGGSTCGANLACSSAGTCACGGLGDPCCGGSTCDSGLSCGTGATCTAGITSIALGKGHACALAASGDVECWGRDGFTFGRSVPGQRASIINSEGAVKVAGISGAVAIAAGEGHSCATKSDGTLWCWGHNEQGQLGNGSTTSSAAAVQVSGLSAVTLFSVGRQHTCALGTVGGTSGLYCWGHNGRRNHTGNTTDTTGRLGNGMTTDSSTPVAVDMTQMTANSATVVALAAGGYNTCAAMSDNTAWCWGSNDSRSLGTNGGPSVSAPAQVDFSQLTIPSGVTIAELASGTGYDSRNSYCMRLSNGSVYCWGPNSSGQGGTGTGGQLVRPTAAVDMTALGSATFVSIAAMNDATCGVDTAGNVWCWGRDKQGQLGNNDANEGTQQTPVQVTGVTGAVKVVANHRTACAIDAQHNVSCWGNNRSGQITKTQPTTADAARVLTAVPVTL